MTRLTVGISGIFKKAALEGVDSTYCIGKNNDIEMIKTNFLLIFLFYTLIAHQMIGMV